MKKNRKAIRLPAARMEVALEAKTLDLEKRTVEIAWYTGATIARMSFFDGPYQLTFSMDSKAVDLSRLNSGRAPFKAGHTGYSELGSVIGVIEKAWLQDGIGRARVRFSSRSELSPLLNDISDGILSNVSMEAVVLELEDVTENGADEKHFLATSWQPMAIALVQVGADQDAQALASGEQFTCHLSLGAPDAPPERKAIMKIKVRLLATNETVEILETDFDETLHSKELEAPKSPKAGDAPTAKAKIDAAIASDKARTAEIKRVQVHFNLDDIWAQKHIKQGTTEDQVLSDAQEQRARVNRDIDGSVRMGLDHDSHRARFDAMTDAIVARSKSEKVPAHASRYQRASLVSMALERVQLRTHEGAGLDARYDQEQIMKLALTTSDFPNLLANAANKILLGDYEHADVTYRKLATRQDLPDFKTASVLKAGDFPIPLLVGESGEVKLGTFSEAKDSFSLASYGRRLMFSFQSIVNDDLGAFGRVMGGYGARLADFENALWFTALISASGAGPTLGDTGALFNATAVTTAGGHANLTASGTAISVDSLGVGRAAVKKQVSLDGMKLNIRAKYLLTSPDKETIADQYTMQIAPALGSSVNPFAGRLETLSDSNLVTANPWYLFADPAIAPVSVYGYLQGQSGPDVASRPGFEVLGVELRVALHFGFAFVDHRGAYRNAGA